MSNSTSNSTSNSSPNGTNYSAVLSAIVNSAANYYNQKQTNKTNKSIAAANNATLIELANTAHQREVEDLMNAGLNPILSAGGSGAATPALQQPDLKSPQIDPYVTTDVIKTLSEAKLNDSQANVNQKTIERMDVENLKDAANTTLIKAQTMWQEIQNDIAKGTKQTEINKKYQELDNMIAQFDDIQSTIYNKQTNTAFQKLQINKYNEIQDANIEKLKSETEYNKRRAGGHSKSRDYGGNVGGGVDVKGPFGTGISINGNIGGKYGHSDTW